MPGDILYWDFDGNGHIDHISVITINSRGHLFYTQHTDDVQDKSIYQGLAGKPNAKVYIAHVIG